MSKKRYTGEDSVVTVSIEGDNLFQIEENATSSLTNDPVVMDTPSLDSRSESTIIGNEFEDTESQSSSETSILYLVSNFSDSVGTVVVGQERYYISPRSSVHFPEKPTYVDINLSVQEVNNWKA